MTNVRTAALLGAVLTFLFCCEGNRLFAQVENAEKETAVAGSVTLKSVLEKYRSRGEHKWEQQIQKLEARNAKESWPDDALLFFGSSSFRLWETMQADMEPFPAINRGYGGAKYVDMVLFAERMLTPHKYRALMLFSANDVKGDKDDSSPAEVACVVREIIRVSQAHQPDAPIFIVEVTPTEARFSAWAETRKINAALREVALTTDNTSFIATAEQFLDANSSPRAEFFVDDKLHLNPSGYRHWARILKFSLESVLVDH